MADSVAWLWSLMGKLAWNEELYPLKLLLSEKYGVIYSVQGATTMMQSGSRGGFGTSCHLARVHGPCVMLQR